MIVWWAGASLPGPALRQCGQCFHIWPVLWVGGHTGLASGLLAAEARVSMGWSQGFHGFPGFPWVSVGQVECLPIGLSYLILPSNSPKLASGKQLAVTSSHHQLLYFQLHQVWHHKPWLYADWGPWGWGHHRNALLWASMLLGLSLITAKAVFAILCLTFSQKCLLSVSRFRCHCPRIQCEHKGGLEAK